MLHNVYPEQILRILTWINSATTICIACFGGHGFGGVTQQRRQRHDSQDGKHKKGAVRFWLKLMNGKHQRRERQQPEQAIVTDSISRAFMPCVRSHLIAWLSASRRHLMPHDRFATSLLGHVFRGDFPHAADCKVGSASTASSRIWQGGLETT